MAKIETTWVFGFAREEPGPEKHGGFDVGLWQSPTEPEFYAAIHERFLTGKSEKKSQLSDNEGDAAVTAKSFSSIALTCERPNKPGPLSFAATHEQFSISTASMRAGSRERVHRTFLPNEY